MIFGSESFQEKDIILLDKVALEELASLYDSASYKQMLGKNFRLYILNASALDQWQNMTFLDQMQNAVDDNSRFILDAYVRKDCIIYPKSMFYRALDYAPGFILDRVITTKST